MSLLEELQKKRAAAEEEEAQAEDESLSGVEVLTQAIKNLPSSAVQLADDLTMPIRHPIQTANSLLSLGKGVVKLIAPGEPTLYDKDEESAKAVGKFFADRYGSMDGFKRSFAEDPLGVLSDVSLIFAGPGALAAKAPGVVGKAGQKLSKTGDIIDPVFGTAKVVGAGAKKLGDVSKPIFGLTTGVGSDAISVAAKAGASNPVIQKLFLDNLRGKIPAESVVPKALSALKDRKVAAQGKFKEGKDLLKLENKSIDFSKLQEKIKDFEKSTKFEDVSELSKKAQKKLKDIKKIVAQWENNPKLHNAKGMDILKRRIDAEYPTGLKVGDSGVVVSEIRNAVKSQILDEVPEYAKVMENYEFAINLEKKFISELSLGKNNAAGTTLRKLQSSLRDNVNTAYGNRLKMLEDLDPNLVTEIGGQALSKVTPRGLQGGVGASAAAYGTFVDPTVLLGLPLQSPRLVGETAFKIGQLQKGLKPLQSQRALDIARGFRLSGEVEGATQLDGAELLKMLLDSKEKEEDFVGANMSSISTDALKLQKEFDEDENDSNQIEKFADGGNVENNNDMANNILKNINQTFSPVELQNEPIKKQIVPLIRISKDAKSQKYSDQVLKELENFITKLDDDLRRGESVPLKKLKNIVDLTLQEKIDRDFIKNNQETINQLKFAPRLYKSYLGLDKNDNVNEAREKTANRILEKVVNKKFNSVETSNFLIAHNKLAPKASVPLFIAKLENYIPEKSLSKTQTSLKDGMLKATLSKDIKDNKKDRAKKFNRLFQENKEIFASLFSPKEMARLQDFGKNVMPALEKKSSLDPNKSEYMFISALSEGGLFNAKEIPGNEAPIELAREGLKNIQNPLVPNQEDVESNFGDVLQSDFVEKITKTPVEKTQFERDDIDNKNILRDEINRFAIPQINQNFLEVSNNDLSDENRISPTIIPDEKDREIAMRQVGGIGSLI